MLMTENEFIQMAQKSGLKIGKDFCGQTCAYLGNNVNNWVSNYDKRNERIWLKANGEIDNVAEFEEKLIKQVKYEKEAMFMNKLSRMEQDF